MRTLVLLPSAFLLLLLAAPASGALQERDIQSIALELKRANELLAAQQQSIDALRVLLQQQQNRLDQLQSAAAPIATAPLAAPVAAAPPAPPAASRWYEKYSLRGYTQIRYNRLLETNRNLTCEACDRSIGNNGGFLIRRARVVLSGDLNNRISMYFQPEFAAGVNGGLNYGQVRDLYFDVALDTKKEFRIRSGLSKVPFSFENLQSSHDRLAMDRSDAVNSAHPNERDTGVFLYYAPAAIRQRFASLVSSGLKGSGDYGVLAIGAYDGQSMGRAEANNSPSYVARASYPFLLRSGRVIEPGLAATVGKYTVTSDQRSASVRGPDTFQDRRVLGSLSIYPKPFGFQSEFNYGTGPRFDPATTRIRQARLLGGYAQGNFLQRLGEGGSLMPFVKYQYYSGGKKNELDARSYLIRDLDFGVEWQKNRYLEILAQYSRSDRTYEDARTPNNRQKGGLFRLQLQLTY